MNHKLKIIRKLKKSKLKKSKNCKKKIKIYKVNAKIMNPKNKLKTIWWKIYKNRIKCYKISFFKVWKNKKL